MRLMEHPELLFKRRLVAPIVLFMALSMLSPALAQTDLPAEDAFPARVTGEFKTAIVIDATTGLTLVATNDELRRPPASMLKMMTELIILEHIEEGDMTLDEVVTVSAKSSNMGGSQVYLKHGESFTVEELLQALAIHSANDAAVALAEHLAGSTDAFIDLMNIKARDLGMNQTEFHSVHGLPPAWRQASDMTTVLDMAILAQELVKHPQALEWASTKTAPFRDGKFTLYNPNKLVGKYRGLDGLKTGYTGAAGFCVTATAVRKGQRLISVVMGCPTDKARATETSRLLTFGFSMYRQVPVFTTAGDPLTQPLRIKGGKKKSVLVTYGESMEVSVPRNRENDLEMEIRLPNEFAAPIAAGTEVGRAVVRLDGIELGSVPIVTILEVEKGNWFNRLMN
ncbi:MAG: D-alanyl-D-alanine carboxypeptidase (penicillin-binding protein 5/6) [Candidatus Krumholzibacteriia bacterium]|jgi:D-alanyl-D-alanine carboxypeptidase (penicillin-binding protein 5/6)